MDDNSNSFAVSVPLERRHEHRPGQSVIFIETASSSELAAKAQAFINLWFGGTAPAGLQIGSYSGSGVGLSTGGDAVNLFDNGGTLHAAISFGASPSGTPLPTFDNSAGLNNAAISSLSVVGQNGAFVAANDANEIGSPGTIGAGATPIVGITAIDALASETGSDPGTVPLHPQRQHRLAADGHLHHRHGRRPGDARRLHADAHGLADHSSGRCVRRRDHHPGGRRHRRRHRDVDADAVRHGQL